MFSILPLVSVFWKLVSRSRESINDSMLRWLFVYFYLLYSSVCIQTIYLYINPIVFIAIEIPCVDYSLAAESSLFWWRSSKIHYCKVNDHQRSVFCWKISNIWIPCEKFFFLHTVRVISPLYVSVIAYRMPKVLNIRFRIFPIVWSCETIFLP